MRVHVQYAHYIKGFEEKLALVPLDAKHGAEQIQNDHFALVYIVYYTFFCGCLTERLRYSKNGNESHHYCPIFNVVFQCGYLFAQLPEKSDCCKI